MDIFTLPPTPNWQLSNVLACNDNGFLAYGSRSEIAILDIKNHGEGFNVRFYNMAHKGKINVVVFSPSCGSFKHCVATCGEDGVVRVWDFEESRLLYSHSGHKDGVKVTGLDWSRADTNRLVSVNDLGTIVCWNLASNTIQSLLCGVKVSPLCLACCPHNKDIIAIGCKGGITLVIDIKGNGKIIHRLRGHDQDVISISWCPVPYNVIKYQRNIGSSKDGDKKEREMLLATGGTERSIFIWRTATDGRFELVINLPNNSFSTNQRKKWFVNGSHIMLWTCVLWVDAFTLLSTSQFGEVLAWDLNTLKANNKQPHATVLHSKHYKGVFAIACPVVYYTDPDWKDDNRVVWTTAMDKHLVACTLVSGQVKQDITTLGGIVYTMDISPLDPNMLAIGSSDGKIFIWNMSDISSLNITTYWKKIIGKVMAVRWHPTEENLLAFGTSDGHVGILDVSSTNKPPTLLRLHHRKSVYRVCWAPPLIKSGDTTKDSKLVLFSLGDGDLFQYTADISEPDKEPKSLNLEVLNAIDQNQGLQKTLIRSDIVFNKTRFAVGCENGSVYIVSCETLKLVHAFHPHKKLMNNLEWHPETVASEDNLSPYRDYLATTCDNIKVYNVPADGQVELVATLSGHSEKIVGLAWSPHYNGRLLSSSYDNSVQVWDVPSQSCLGIYLGHNMAVMCALFSPLDPDIIISGSFDQTVQLWTSAVLVTPSTKPNSKKTRLVNALKEINSALHATELTVGMSDISENSDPANEPETQSTSLNNSMNIDQSSTSEEKAVEEYKKRQKNRAMFIITGPQLTQARHFDLLVQRRLGSAVVSETEDEPSLSNIGYLDFFGDEKAMRRLLMVEESQLDSRQHMLAQQSALWRGDVSQMIQEAIIKKQMSDWLVSIAPLAGFDVWEKACNAYASHLADCGNVNKAACYLLATHRIHDAVRLLADYKLFREAVAVARCRLPPDDPLAATVYAQWGDSARHMGLITLAAHCYLAAGDMHTCIETLGRHKELRSLKTAAALAQQNGQTELAASLAVECLTLSIAAHNFAIGHELVGLMPQFQAWSVWLHVAEQMTRVCNRSAKEVFAWLEGHRHGPFLLWDELDKILNGTKVPGTLYQQLLPYIPTNKTPEFERDMWFYMSSQVAAAYAAKLEAKPALFLRHIVSALSAAFHYQTFHPQSLALLLNVFIISPNGLFSKDSILKEECGSTEEKKLMKSLRAFVCASIIHWMNNNWDKVTRMKTLNGETAVENGGCQESEGGDSSETEMIMPCKMAWLPDLLTNYSCDVLDAENKSFFLKKSQRQALQNVVEKQNIQKYCVDKKTESEKIKIQAKGNGDYGKGKSKNKKSAEKNLHKKSVSGDVKEVKKLDENLNVKVAELQPNMPTLSSAPALHPTLNEDVILLDNKSDKTTAKLEEPENTLFDVTKTPKNELSTKHDCNKALGVSDVDSEKPNGEISKPTTSLEETPQVDTANNYSSDLKPLESILELKQTNDNIKEDKIIETVKDTNAMLKEIKELEKILGTFESERVAVPSPFTAYINIKYLIDNLICKEDSKLAQKLQENCDQLWEITQQ